MKLVFTLSSLFLFSILNAQQSTVQEQVTRYFQNQEYEEAIQYLIPISSRDSGNIQVLGYLGYAYNMSDQAKTAAFYYQKILSIDSLNITANQQLANFYGNKNPEIAQELTAKLIRLQPTKALHYRTMGNLLSRKKEKDSALIYLETAYQLSPGDLRNVSTLADVLLDTKNYVRADSIIYSGLNVDSTYTPLLIAAIRSAYEMDRYDSAIAPGKMLMTQLDVTLKPMAQLILSYYQLNRYEECIEVCEYLRSQEIETEAVNYYEAKAWSKLKEFDKSNALLHKCLESALSDKAELYYFALADNDEETKNYISAIAHYDTSYYLFKTPLAKYNVGRIYENNLRNPELANRYFKKYLVVADTSDPDEKKVYFYLNRRYKSKK